MQVAKGFLLGNDGDVVLRGVGDEFAGLVGSEGAAGERRDRRAGVGEGVFEVGREQVVLVSGESADFALEEVHVGERAARPVVGEGAVGHGGPVADGGDEENRVFAGTADELLDRLGTVEEAGGGLRNHHQAGAAIGQDGIALIVHGWVEGDAIAA